MSFWDNVKKFAQPYSDEDYDDYDEEMDEYEEEGSLYHRKKVQVEQDGTATLKNARCVQDNGGLALWEADLEITCWEDL